MEIIARLANLPGALPGACAQGLIWGIMAIGVYLTYRILDVADLTVDGSFGTGGAVCVMCLLSGMLFGPVLGGLAAGFGSMLYDALFGGYDLINCLITFVSKFLMAAICAWIAFGGKEEGKGKHAWLAIIVAALAAIFAAVGAVKYLLPVVKALSVLLPPIPAMMIAEQWCVKNSKENQNINWVGIVSWIVATVIGQICVNRNFLIPAVVSMVVAFFLYWGLSKALDKSWNKEATGKAE